MKSLSRAFGWLLVAPAILPVVLVSEVVYPYLIPKTLLFYALTLVTVGIFAILVAAGERFYFARLSRPHAWIPAALLALAYGASWFGLGFYQSFWSTFVRGDGLLMLTCAAASFYLIVLSADRAFLARLLRAAALIGSIAALYGIGEWILTGGRIGSLLGNAAFFAGYLGIAFFATLLAAQELPQPWRRAAYFGAGAQIIAILLSATRGTIVALIAAGLVTLGYFAWKGQGRIRRNSAVALGGFAILAGLFVGLRGELARVPITPVARLASISAQDPDVASRLFIWRNMTKEIAQHPFLGVGTEHIDTLFNSFYDPTQIQEQWFDRSHNAFLDYAAQYGLGGLILYILLIGSYFLAARRLKLRGEGRAAGLVALLAVTYAVQNFFVFDTISSFWLFLGLLAALLSTALPEVEPSALPVPAWTRAASWVFAAVLVLCIIPVSLRPLRAAHDLWGAYAYALTDPARSLAYFNEGIALHTYGDLEYGYEAYDIYVDHQYGSLKGDALVQAYTAAKNILTDNFNRYPHDARTALYLAHVLALPPPGVSQDGELLSEALTRTIKESPKRPQAWYLLVNNSIAAANEYPAGSSGRAAQYAAAKDILERYLTLVPNLAEPHYVLAELEYSAGDARGAAEEAVLGKADYTPDLTTARRAAGYYEQVKDWQDAAFFLQQAVTLGPADAAMRYDLAKVSYLSGDLASADQLFQELKKTDPALVASDPNFEAAITQYEQTKP